MILRHEHNLAVLRIRLDRRGRQLDKGRRASAVVFEMVVGTDPATELARVPPAELGLPEDGLGGSRGDLPITLPAGLLEQPALRQPLIGRSALWLELPAPSGPLRPLPWETALLPLGVPVLRLPYFSLRPTVTSGPLSIAICASSPRAKGQIDVSTAVGRFVSAAQSSLGPTTRFHVFADEEWFNDLVHSLYDVPAVQVHDSRIAAMYAPAERRTGIDGGTRIRSPWLRWMRWQLAESAIDHVHFYCHGYLTNDGGAIAVAPSPLVNDDPLVGRFVGAPEMVTLLSTLGAWSVGFTGPEGNYSELGLRALADAVAESRPGPVLAHEADSDRDFAELGRALAVGIGPGSTASPGTGHTALWVHPQRVEQAPYPTVGGLATPGDELLDDTSQSVLFGTATSAALASPETPTWVASSARVLEQAQAAWLSTTQTGMEGSPDPAGYAEQAAEALRYASELLERHVRQTGVQP